jgi:hypothetical protein
VSATARVTDFLMNESASGTAESATPTGMVLESPVGDPFFDNMYARTLKRRGPGRPRVRPDPSHFVM